MNCQLCVVSFIYVFAKDPTFTLKQCFSVIVLDTLENGIMKPLKNPNFHTLKQAREFQSDSDTGFTAYRSKIGALFYIMCAICLILWLVIMTVTCYQLCKDRKRYSEIVKSRDFSYPLDAEEMMDY